MSAMCSTTFASNSRCHQAAQMYKLGVSMFGGAPFQNMQSQVCDCVDDADVAEKVRAVVPYLDSFRSSLALFRRCAFQP